MGPALWVWMPWVCRLTVVLRQRPPSLNEKGPRRCGAEGGEGGTMGKKPEEESLGGGKSCS